MGSARRSASLAAAVVCGMMGVVSIAAGAEGGCPNEAFRTGLSANLPDCRAYELVTPPYTEGAPTGSILAVSPGGSRAIAQSIGDFGDAGAAPSNEGSTYELSRTATGWGEAGIDLSQSRFPFDRFKSASEDLSETLWEARTTSQPREARDLYVRDADGALRDLGPTTNPEGTKNGLPGLGYEIGGLRHEILYWGASRDLSHVLFAIPTLESVAKEALEPQLWPGDRTVPAPSNHHGSLYEYTAAGAEGAEPRLVGVENVGPLGGRPHVNEDAKLVSECGTHLGSIEAGGDGESAVSETGATVFFTAAAATEGTGNEHCNSSNEGTGPPVNELDARVDGEKTLKISSPSHPLGQGAGSGPEECDSACEAAALQAGVFQGASREGSKAFFLTKQPLLNGDEGGTGTGQDLYEAEIEGEGAGAKIARLVQVSHDPNAGQAAEVQGVTRVSKDGSHVYFVAKGELASNSSGQASFSTAQNEAENLYVYEPDPANPGHYKTVFVAMLCSEAGLSGSVPDSECNSSDEQMWNVGGEAPAQATPDGRFLVFSTATDLTAPEDTSTVDQVFRYDAETGALVRVSVGQRGTYECPTTKAIEKGFNCSGNTDTFPVSIRNPTAGRPVAISEDGSYVAFQSANGLTPGALNGQVESYTEEVEAKNFEGTETRERSYFANNVYEYHDGEVSLISDGVDTSATVFGHIGAAEASSVQVEGMTPSGTDVFFKTADRLVPQDTDSQQDIYDARIGGGFPPPPVSTPCREEACQGSPGAAPSFGAPSSTTFSGAGNLAPPPATVPPNPKTAAQIKAEKLAKALKVCKKDKKKAKRTNCEKQARKRFGTAKQAKKASNERRAR
jgi:hypothetical protein